MVRIIEQQGRVLMRLRAQRHALTTLEFVGCAIAVVGGAWLGAICLGIDVQQVAHNALAESRVLDKLPAEWRPAAPEDDPMTRQALVVGLRNELTSLRGEIAALRKTGSEGKGAAPYDAGAELREKTRAYWSRLSEIELSQAALQQDAQTAFDQTTAAKVYAIRGRISRFAAKAVEAVPTDMVEPAMKAFGQELAGWYERGGALYERAVQIWDRAPGDAVRERLEKEWRAAELQYRNEARLLRERAATVRNAVSRQFGEEFPAFAQETHPSNEGEGDAPAP